MSNDILTHTETKPKDKKAAKLDDLKQQHAFYNLKHKDGLYLGLIIKKAKIVDKLKDYNFFRFDIDAETCRFVYIENNKVREVSKEQITDRFVKFVETLKPYKHRVMFYDGKGNDKQETETEIEIKAGHIRETLFEKLSEYFSKALLYRLVPDKPIEIKKDTKTEKFFYFKNGFVSVTSKGLNLLDYKKLDLNIWENQKLNRDFKPDKTKGDYEKFIERVCTVKNTDNVYVFDERRFKALRTIIGYNLHGFFEGRLVATILTDSRISDGDEANGRSGKTLIAKGLGQILNFDKLSRVYSEINGKDFNPKDKHRYGDSSIETQLININDLSKNISIENFFNDITEGVTIDKKNEKPFSIQSKIIISTNKTIKIEGDSAIDRVTQFELSDFFNKDHSPEKEFNGKWMFSQDWNQTDWNQFDTFIIGCVAEYLKHGIIKAPSINLHRRSIIDQTGHEFVDFIDDFFITKELKLSGQTADLYNNNDTIKLIYGEKLDKKLLYTAFTEQYSNDFKQLKQSTFTKWLRTYAKYTKGLQAVKKPHTEGRSNGLDWIIFLKEESEQSTVIASK